MFFILLAAASGAVLATGVWLVWDGLETIEIAADQPAPELEPEGRRGVAVGSGLIFSGVAVLAWLLLKSA